ncbi:transmembrane protein 68-like protein [Leptotrombidium deliense]|uniref:Transmembrane protein 68-like protein n=1 Tax=Leptotrombidium deliense TaxID=299467 RepID=A0A443SR81_9ACAR|nr:transmembrane protein 68-like protein [Leptotrombidium deliense]
MLIYLLSAVFTLFALPYFVLSIVGFLAPLIVFVYKFYHKILLNKETCIDYIPAKKLIAFIFTIHGYIWHSYEIVNFENIPETGAALIIYYHAALPLDYYYLISHCYLFKNRHLRTIADRFLFKIPVFNIFMDVMKASPGSVELCTQMLKEGKIVAIAPGGVREAMFSRNYNLIWNNRIGFAKVAIAAKVPIIPVFTVNIREAYRTISFGEKLFQKLYEITKFPVVPIYGGFPVKLKTVIGTPIEFESDLTAEQLAMKTAEAIKALIKEHQTIPGSIIDATLERFTVKSKNYC